MAEDLLFMLSYIGIGLAVLLLLFFLIGGILTLIKKFRTRKIKTKNKDTKIKFFKFLDIYLVSYGFYLFFLTILWLLELFN